LKGGTLPTLLHLCDSLFPTGGFGYSEGLETATASGQVASADHLREWVDVCLEESIGRVEAPTVWQAWPAFVAGDWRTLERLDREMTALRPASASRRANRAMGWRLATTWQALHPEGSLDEVIAMARAGDVGPTFPVAFACACASSGIERRATVEAFAYNRLAATISAAMRLMPIGQTAAHAVLAAAAARVPAVMDRMAARDADAEAFAPSMDLAVMSQQYLHSRLFRS
jgi:urease accessory protein